MPQVYVGPGRALDGVQQALRVPEGFARVEFAAGTLDPGEEPIIGDR